MKRAKLLPILLEVILMLALFGCGKTKYTLDFDGYGFESPKTEYAAGETVTVYYDMIATDTDYRFWLDDDSIRMKQDYDDRHGYVFTFTMPEHDVTMHMESHNSMMYIPQITVSVVNEAEEADFWILPQTEDNLKTTLWGTATVASLGVGERAEARLEENGGTWLVRIIDRNHAYYSMRDVTLKDGYSIVFRSAKPRNEATVEVLDADGAVILSQRAFTGMLGGG